ncbi:MAG: hypothetical protein WCX23_03820 [Candidatus Paceibacterota bacterium]|jgi:hypothetical protein|nr:hypothetical protein [Candidatus Paceibacterota bacterium]MDD4831169.1 hypothetical protein [Candidatus Paceibacterota bacterium]MDD4875503.1 hypothetical protein [Candidatus Paceibacterota bacterium]
MNFQILAQIVLVTSFLGLAAIILKKMPLLAEAETSDGPLGGGFLRLKEKFREINPLKGAKPEIFLQKVLSKIRIWSLRADNKASDLIQILRERAEKKNNFLQIFSEKKEKTENPDKASNIEKGDNYWQEIKTSISPKKNRKGSAPKKRLSKKPKKKETL